VFAASVEHRPDTPPVLTDMDSPSQRLLRDGSHISHTGGCGLKYLRLKILKFNSSRSERLRPHITKLWYV